MNWKKIGQVFHVDKQFPWLHSHATAPMAMHLENNDFRIFFSVRNQENKNQIAFIDIDITDPKNTKHISQKPALEPGETGHFDGDGVYGTGLVKHNKKLYLYYAGWTSGANGLFYAAIGLAISHNNGLSFERVSKAPILDRDDVEPWAVMAPFVLKEENIWRLYYTSGIKLYKEDNILKSLHDIKYAESRDGINWKKTKQISIPLEGDITNIARANVVKHNNKYQVWFPYLSKQVGSYRIACGDSEDGIHFNNFQYDKHIKTSDKKDWDSDSVAFPYVFRHKDKEYMLYNGNGGGKTGFGLASRDIQ